MNQRLYLWLLTFTFHTPDRLPATVSVAGVSSQTLEEILPGCRRLAADRVNANGAWEALFGAPFDGQLSLAEHSKLPVKDGKGLAVAVIPLVQRGSGPLLVRTGVSK